MTNKEFFEDLISVFPNLKISILEWDEEMVHFRMEVFADYTNQLIGYANIPEIQKCFEFQESRIESMSLELLNALNVSYCEALLLGENTAKMKAIAEIMPTKLLNIYLDYEKYYEALSLKSRA